MVNTDMSFCSGVGCKIKETCTRYTGVPKKCTRDVYWVDPQYDSNSNSCKFFRQQ